MNGSKELGSCTQEDPSHVVVDLVVAPVGVDRAFVRLAQAASRPVQARGLPQPLGRGHGAVARDLLGRWPVHEPQGSTRWLTELLSLWPRRPGCGRPRAPG